MLIGATMKPADVVAAVKGHAGVKTFRRSYSAARRVNMAMLDRIIDHNA